MFANENLSCSFICILIVLAVMIYSFLMIKPSILIIGFSGWSNFLIASDFHHNHNKSKSRIEMIVFSFSAALMTFCWHLNHHFDIIKATSRTFCIFLMSDQHINKLVFLFMNPIFCSFCPNMYWKSFHCLFIS